MCQYVNIYFTCLICMNQTWGRAQLHVWECWVQAEVPPTGIPGQLAFVFRSYTTLHWRTEMYPSQWHLWDLIRFWWGMGLDMILKHIVDCRYALCDISHYFFCRFLINQVETWNIYIYIILYIYYIYIFIYILVIQQVW